MPKQLKIDFLFFIIIFLAFFTRLFFLIYPSEVVFDEVYFGKFVSAYFSGKYYFDIHPPLGKLIIAGFAKIFNYQGNLIFSHIGKEIESKFLFILRFLPAFFGALFVILIYKFILLINLSRKAAFLGSFLILFENSFLVQSKFIFLDIFLLFFGFSSLYFFILAKKSDKKNLFYILSAIFAGFSFSIKWTGLSFLGIILFFIFLDFLKNLKIKNFLFLIIIFITFSFLTYLSPFIIHFHLLRLSGPGDPFMSPSFQKTLLGNKISKEISPLSFWQKFIELNIIMFKANAGIKATHPNESKWYEWPLMRKPIWYWSKNLNGKFANIYFLGNFLIYFLVFLAILLSLLTIFLKRFRKKLPFIIYLFLFGYFLNLLPFIFITRVVFLYHYLPSLTFGILVLTLFYDKFFQNKINFQHYYGFLFLIFLIFLFFSPLTYGFSVPNKLYQIYSIFIQFLS